MPKSTIRNAQDIKTSMSAPALTPEGRENQLISLAYDLVEQRLRDGTASSQETTSILRLASVKEQLEQEKLRKELKMIEAKTSQLESQANIEKLYSEAIAAMKSYAGKDEDNDDETEC